MFYHLDIAELCRRRITGAAEGDRALTRPSLRDIASARITTAGLKHSVGSAAATPLSAATKVGAT
jgi:hypothetical protein